jgi:hypothetical protein
MAITHGIDLQAPLFFRKALLLVFVNHIPMDLAFIIIPSIPGQGCAGLQMQTYERVFSSLLFTLQYDRRVK